MVATGPSALRPPISSSPSVVTAAAAAERGSGSVRASGAACHSPSSPVTESGVRTKTVSVGAPGASVPPMT